MYEAQELTVPDKGVPSPSPPRYNSTLGHCPVGGPVRVSQGQPPPASKQLQLYFSVLVDTDALGPRERHTGALMTQETQPLPAPAPSTSKGGRQDRTWRSWRRAHSTYYGRKASRREEEQRSPYVCVATSICTEINK